MSNRSTRRLPTLLLALAVVSASLASSRATAAPPTLREWSNEVWSAAMEGDVAQVETLLGAVPAGESGVTDAFRAMVASRNEHANESDEGRRKDLEKAIEELQTQLEANELTKALTAAVRRRPCRTIGAAPSTVRRSRT